MAGFREAKRVHDVAQAAGIPVWCGGMLEAGIGRAHNIALATPAELRAARRRLRQQALLEAGHHSARRWKPRRTAPSQLRDEPGFGYALDLDFIRSITVREESICVEPSPSMAGIRLDCCGGNHNYRNTWIGQVVSEIGDHFNNIAVFSLALARHRIGTGGQRRDAGARHSRDAGRTAGRRAARPLRPQAHDDRERPGAGRGRLLLHPHGQPHHDTWLLYLLSGLLMFASPFFTSGRAAILPSIATGRGTAHRQFADPDHAVDHADDRRVSGRGQRHAVRLQVGLRRQRVSFLFSALCISRLSAARAFVQRAAVTEDRSGAALARIQGRTALHALRPADLGYRADQYRLGHRRRRRADSVQLFGEMVFNRGPAGIGTIWGCAGIGC